MSRHRAPFHVALLALLLAGSAAAEGSHLAAVRVAGIRQDSPAQTEARQAKKLRQAAAGKVEVAASGRAISYHGIVPGEDGIDECRVLFGKVSEAGGDDKGVGYTIWDPKSPSGKFTVSVDRATRLINFILVNPVGGPSILDMLLRPPYAKRPVDHAETTAGSQGAITLHRWAGLGVISGSGSYDGAGVHGGEIHFIAYCGPRYLRTFSHKLNVNFVSLPWRGELKRLNDAAQEFARHNE